MNALLEHRWGVSAAQDRVWAHVTGLAPRMAVGRLLMVTQAFMDESMGDDSGVFVLGGHIASAETWVRFTQEWEELLPRFGVLSGDNRYHFKMSEMTCPGRIDNVLPFYRAIERHNLLPISFKLNVRDLRRAQARVSIGGTFIDWGYVDNHYSFSMRSLMDLFHSNKGELQRQLSLEEPIDFIFDERAEKKAILAGWDMYLANKPEDIRKCYGSHPRFEHDHKFLPLQAADFWAWWVREWYEQAAPERIVQRDFGVWPNIKPTQAAIIGSMSEDQIAENFVSWFRAGTDRHVFDSKYFPRPAGTT